MSESLVLDSKEILHGHWHMSGTRKYDALIQILKSANCAMTIGVHDSDATILKLSNALPNCEVVYADVAYDMDVFVVPVLSASQAKQFHQDVPVGTGIYTLASWEAKSGREVLDLNRLSVHDGKLEGIIRYGEDK